MTSGDVMNGDEREPLIYACVTLSPTRELEVGPLDSWEEALAVEEVMRERVAELVAAEDLIHVVGGDFVQYERWSGIHDEVIREGRERLAKRPGIWRMVRAMAGALTSARLVIRRPLATRRPLRTARSRTAGHIALGAHSVVPRSDQSCTGSSSNPSGSS